MDYEQKYKEALERAKVAHKDEDRHFKATLERIFPELKESEDERVRKEFCKDIRTFIPNEKANKYIAWLEKQGKETSWKPSKEEMDVLYGLAYITNQYDEHKEEVITRLYQDLKREFFNGSSYENMFSTNTCTEDDVRRRSTIQVLEYARSLDVYNQYGKADIDKNIAWLEKQEKQKPQGKTALEAVKEEKIDNQNCVNPADKVKPKFHEGDWVVNKLGDSWHIDSFDKENYQVSNGKGNYNWFPISKQDEMHLWTIRDAKDGDVLASKDEIEILIFRNLDTSTSFSSYYNITGRGDFGWSNICFIPATKEQCNLLFEKMKEKGYKWDNEKKELNKIEQNAVSNIEPKFHPGDWVIDNVGYIYQIESATEIESEHIFGYTIVGGGYFNDNNDVRLWSIDDAKRGDVLVDVYGNIGIFDKCYDFDWMSCCSLGNNGGFQHFTVEHENEKTYPATKEQYNLFFSKMKEAGWEWDCEKKELKQIKDNTLEMRGNQVVSEIVKNQKEIPGEFTKLVHENFWDLIKTEHKMLDADKVIEWFRVNWWDSHIGDPIDKFKKDFGL